MYNLVHPVILSKKSLYVNSSFGIECFFDAEQTSQLLSGEYFMRELKIPKEELLIETGRLEQDEPFEWGELYGNDHPVEMEIGVGKGRYLREMAARHPEKNYFAIERAKKYARIALERAARDGLTNFRIFMGDAPELLGCLVPDESLAALYIFYSDPWPKKRHHKRRLFNPANVALFGRKLASGAPLIVKTDYESYFEIIDQIIRDEPALQIIQSGPADSESFEPALRTNFEVKTVGRGAKVFFLEAHKTFIEDIKK